jgi:hypothetical protein
MCNVHSQIGRRFVYLMAVSLCAAALANDLDSDGVADGNDNCVLAANPGQLDADADGWGNRCDADFNNDGIVNSFDLGILRDGFLGNNPLLDLNEDGLINATDLGIMRLLFFLPPGPAGFAHWTNPKGGAWTVSANWFPAVVPPLNASVRIELAGDYSVDFGDDATAPFAQVASLTCAHPFTMRGGTLRIAGSFSSSADVTLAGGTLGVGEDLHVDAQLHIAGGRLDDATVSAAGPIMITTHGSRAHNVTLASNAIVMNGARLSVAHDLTLAGADLTLASTGNASFVSFEGTQTLGGNGRVVLLGTVAFDNSNRLWQNVADATLTIGSGILIEAVSAGGRVGANEIDGRVVLEGSALINLPERQITFAGRFENDGLIEAGNGARLLFDGSFTNRGTIHVANGEFEIAAFSDAPWTNQGVIDLDASPASIGGSFLTATLATLSTEGPVVITGNIDNTGALLNTDLFPAGFALTRGGQIRGGQIAGITALSIADIPPFSAAVPAHLSDGVTLGTDMVISNATVLVTGGLDLQDVTVKILSDSGIASSLGFEGTQTLGGQGRVEFGDAEHPRIAVLTVAGDSDAVLTIGAGITVQPTGAWARVGSFSRGLIFNGTVVADDPAQQLSLWGRPFVLNGNLNISAGAVVKHVAFADVTPSESFVMSQSAQLSIEIGPDNPGLLDLDDSGILGGTLNLVPVDGFQGAPCDEFVVIGIPPDLPPGGMFHAVNAGGQLELRALVDEVQAVVADSLCEFEIDRLLGTAIEASSNQADLDRLTDEFTFTAWCSDATDLAPRLNYDFPEALIVDRISLRSLSPGFVSGDLRFFNAGGDTVFEASGVDLISSVVTQISLGGIAGVVRFEFEGVPMPGLGACMAGIDIFGSRP